ncbi:lantibiotic dehydratase [Streptomyces sp. NPDC098789]|uniref:lantibiotic dehydratase n=1 Tax=Streptomyces sp. NPDC098789 TaxID=3366098 RepID=UPI003812D0F5
MRQFGGGAERYGGGAERFDGAAGRYGAGVGPLTGPGAESGEWIAPTFVVRVAGVPAGELTALRAPRTWAAVDSLVPAHRWLAEEGRQLSGLLARLAGRGSTTGASGLRPAVTEVRSALAGLVPPDDWVWGQQVWDALPVEVCERVERWLGELERYRLCTAELAGIHAAEKPATTAALRTAVGGRSFRRGLVQGSPEVFEQLDGWLQDPAALPGDTVLRLLARQVARAATRPSRYATYTVTADGSFRHAPRTDDAPAAPPDHDRRGDGADPAPRSVVEPSARMLQQLARQLATRPELARRLAVRVNPSAVEEDGHLWFLSAETGEPVARTPADEGVRSCLRLVREAPGGATLGGLRADLLALGGRTPRQADALVDALAAVGLLELRLPFADQAPDQLGELLAWLGPPGGRSPCLPYGAGAPDTPSAATATATATASASVPGSRSVAAPLRELRRLLRAYEDSDSPGERAATRTAARTVPCRAALAPTADQRTRIPARARPRTAARAPFHESFLSDTSTALPWERWQPVCADLQAVRRLAGLFDADLPLKLALASVLRDRFPDGLPLLSFYRYVQQSAHAVHAPAPGRIGAAELLSLLAGPASPEDDPAGTGAAPAGSTLGPLRQLARLRAHALALLGDGPRDPAGPDGAGPVRAGADRLDAFLDELPAHVRAPESLTCFVQPLEDGPSAGDPEHDRGPAPQRLVLAGLGTGFGAGRARYERLRDQDAARRDADPADATAPAPAPRPRYTATVPGRVYAETDGAFGSNLNLRTPGVAHRIDYPFTTTGADCPEERRIQLTDLRAVLDPATGLPVLRSARLDSVVVPLHLGSMAVPLLPPALRFLVRGFGVHGAPERLPWDAPGPPTPAGAVGFRPRVELGRLTLRRATWRLPVRLFPVRRPTEPEHTYLVRLAAWLDGHGLPREFFARVVPGCGAPGPRPLYVDVAVHPLLAAFTRSLPGGGRVADAVLVLQEALPGPERQTRATEYALEINGPEVRCGEQRTHGVQAAPAEQGLGRGR